MRAPACAGKDQQLSKDRISLRGIAVATGVVVASTGLTVGVNSLASGSQTSGGPAVTRVGPLPDGAAVRRGGQPAGQRLQEIKKKQRRLAAARAVREARERRERAARSASRAPAFRGDARGIAAEMAAERYGWKAGEFSCLDALWARESGWDVHASNPSSGAYGIPQALPGSKMSAFGSDWQSNPVTQIEWGLDYIDGRYGSPCGAWNTFQSQGWY
jgi:hypothetical protein